MANQFSLDTEQKGVHASDRKKFTSLYQLSQQLVTN